MCILYVAFHILNISNSIGASGTNLTCTVQASLIMFPGYSITIYYASLSLISYIAVKNAFNEMKYKKIEPIIHMVALGLPLGLMVIGIKKNYFNPGGPWCWVNSFPSGCEANEEVECQLKVKTAYRGILERIMNGMLMFMLIMMLLIYYEIKKSRKPDESMAGNAADAARFRRQKSRIVLLQIFLYFSAFFVTYIVGIAVRTTQWDKPTFMFPANMAGIVLVSMQGFFNMMVYVLLRNSAKNRHTNTHGPFRHVTAFCDNSNGVGVNNSNILASGQQGSSYEFSIFEGIAPPEIWENFMGQSGESNDEKTLEDAQSVHEDEVIMRASVTYVG